MAEQERSYSTISSSTTDLGSNRNKVITKKTTTVTPVSTSNAKHTHQSIFKPNFRLINNEKTIAFCLSLNLV